MKNNIGFETMRRLLPLLLAALVASPSVVSDPAWQQSVSLLSEDQSPSHSEPWLHPFLPDNLEPVEYSLYQFPDLYFDGSVFSGNVSIRIKVYNETDTILVHIKALNVTGSTVLDENGNQLILNGTFEYKPNEYWVVRTMEPLPTGTEATLKFNFTGSLTNGIVGLYKCTYVNDITRRKSWLATTLFQLNEARKAFPCFDEPRFKSPFTITLRHWKNFSAISNMPSMGHVVYDDVWQESTFHKTPPLSTYHVGFVVSDFVNISNTLSNGKQNRVWARPDRLRDVNNTLHISRIISNFYAHQLAESYNSPKLDHVIVPELAPDAMEQWGLITYKESLLLQHPDYEYADQNQRIVSLVAHEMAHNYFGNLVTCRDWSEFWLNEGFASFYELKGAAEVDLTMFHEGQFFSRFVQPVMLMDAVNNSRPLVMVTETPKGFVEASDVIVYDKGAAILKMIESLLGPSVFRQGIRRFIQQNKYKTVVTNDLWAAFDEIEPNPLLEWYMSNWIYNMGYPVVTIISRVNDSSLAMTQKRFMLDPTSDPQSPPSRTGYWWHIPVRYRTQTGQSGFFWLDETITTVANPKTPDDKWILLNYDHCGYYLVNYNSEQWNSLIKQLNDNHMVFNELEKSKLLSDAHSLARAEQLNYSVALDMTEYAQRDISLLPWDTIGFSFRYINSMLFNTGEHRVFQSYVRNLTTDIMNKLGVRDDEDVASRSHYDKLLRSRIIRLSCYSGHEGCQRNTTRLFIAWLEDEVTNAIPVDLRRDVYYEGIASSLNESDWHAVWDRYIVATSVHEKENLLYALSATKNIELIESLLEYSMDESQVRSEDFLGLINSISSNLVANYHVWQWLERNYDLIIDRFGDSMIGNILPEIVYNFNTRAKRQEVQDFFEILHPGGDKKYRTAAFQTIDANIRWMERCFPDVTRWLERKEQNG